VKNIELATAPSIVDNAVANVKATISIEVVGFFIIAIYLKNNFGYTIMLKGS
jgi:hypothetical protein